MGGPKKWNKHRNFKRNNRQNNFGNNNATKNNSKEYSQQEQLTEPEVGITEFVSKDLEGFSAIIKARFSDFHVNEIDLDGNVARLTNREIPKDEDKVEKIEDLTKSPLEIISQDIWEKIKNIVDKKEVEPEPERVILDATNFTKEDRTKIHETIKKAFGQKIVASTVTEGDKKLMEFKKYCKETTDSRSRWPDNRPEYVHFLVYKEAVDTLDAASKISDCLRIGTSNFNYAGVKDKRAKTTQWFSARKVDPWKLIIKTKMLKNIKTGNICFKDHPMKLGQLKGNLFRIVLRNVKAEDELIKQAVESVQTKGYINYYGLQRFGNDKEVPTYLIGINLLLGKFKEAVELILKPKKADEPDSEIAKAKKIYAETGNAEQALKEVENGQSFFIEHKLLTGLAKENENNYVNALENIPRNTRLLYIHSFQSLVWNRMVSKRLQTFGFQPVVGDFVLLDEKIANIEEISEESEEENERNNKQEVKSLSEQDLDKYSIYDIVLPLPGYDIDYPKHMEEFYKEILQESGLELEMPQQKVKTYTLSGTYRKIMGQLNDLSWKIMHYNNPIENLILSDWEAFKGHPAPKGTENGEFKALYLEFSLSPSSYATMVLREILKTDTSSSAQAKLNNYHEFSQSKNPKILIASSASTTSNSDDATIGEIGGNSLLADKEKFDQFKNSIFGTDSNESKRKPDENDSAVDGQSKRQKTDN